LATAEEIAETEQPLEAAKALAAILLGSDGRRGLELVEH
jgi:hypothetical protein